MRRNEIPAGSPGFPEVRTAVAVQACVSLASALYFRFVLTEVIRVHATSDPPGVNQPLLR